MEQFLTEEVVIKATAGSEVREVVDDPSIINRLGQPRIDIKDCADILPGQDITEGLQNEIQARTLNIQTNLTDNAPAFGELAGRIELDPTDPVLNDLSQNLNTGYNLAASFFEASTPARSIRNILAKDLKTTSEALISLKESEKQLLFRETSEIIESNKDLSTYLHALCDKALSNELTRFEAAFIRGFLAGVIPSYNEIKSLSSLGNNLNNDEQKLFEKILNNKIEYHERPLNVQLEAFRTSEGDFTYGPEEIKDAIRYAKYWEFRNELSTSLTEKQQKALDTVHGGFAAIAMHIYRGGRAGFFVGIPYMLINSFTNFEFVNSLDKIGLMNHFMVPCTLIGAVGMGIYQIVSMIKHKGVGQPIEDSLNEKVNEYSKQVGKEDSAWIAEGIRLNVLDPVKLRVEI